MEEKLDKVRQHFDADMKGDRQLERLAEEKPGTEAFHL